MDGDDLALSGALGVLGLDRAEIEWHIDNRDKRVTQGFIYGMDWSFAVDGLAPDLCRLVLFCTELAPA
jgi:hypothetical protein